MSSKNLSSIYFIKNNQAHTLSNGALLVKQAGILAGNSLVVSGEHYFPSGRMTILAFPHSGRETCLLSYIEEGKGQVYAVSQ